MHSIDGGREDGKEGEGEGGGNQFVVWIFPQIESKEVGFRGFQWGGRGGPHSFLLIYLI